MEHFFFALQGNKWLHLISGSDGNHQGVATLVQWQVLRSSYVRWRGSPAVSEGEGVCVCVCVCVCLCVKKQ